MPSRRSLLGFAKRWGTVLRRVWNSSVSANNFFVLSGRANRRVTAGRQMRRTGAGGLTVEWPERYPRGGKRPRLDGWCAGQMRVMPQRNNTWAGMLPNCTRVAEKQSMAQRRQIEFHSLKVRLRFWNTLSRVPLRRHTGRRKSSRQRSRNATMGVLLIKLGTGKGKRCAHRCD